jgi:cobalt/nickel transport system permease protein
MLGVMAAFIFAAQAINFPVFGGTSGHLIGAALVAIVVGPWPAVLVMTVVVGLQSLLFQDGGLLALGWNTINMAGIAVLSAALVYGFARRFLGPGRKSIIVATAAAAWVSVVLSSISAGIALALSDPGLVAAVPAMAGIHAVIGIGEALITVAAVLLIARSRPATLIHEQSKVRSGSAYLIGAGLIVALLVAAFSVFSSPDPDGLERVAIDFGFADRALDPIVEIMPDYTLPGIPSDFGGVVAVISGVILVLILVLFLGLVIRKVQSRRTVTAEHSASEGG